MRVSLDELADRASRIKSLFDQNQIRVHPTSGIGKLLAVGDVIRDLEDDEFLEEGQFLRALHLERVSKAILPLKGHKDAVSYLKKLASGDLDFLSRQKSDARNFLFELEIWRVLNDRKPDSAQLDEPDVYLELPSGRLGFACKKTYSPSGVSSVLSKGVSQIAAATCEHGVVAFNIDELLPEYKAVHARTSDEASNFLSMQCATFLNDPSDAFIRYFKDSRIIGSLAVVSSIIETSLERPTHSNLQQWFFWTVPDVEDKAKSYAQELKQFIGQTDA